jgi:hypothetical protein
VVTLSKQCLGGRPADYNKGLLPSIRAKIAVLDIYRTQIMRKGNLRFTHCCHLVYAKDARLEDRCPKA